MEETSQTECRLSKLKMYLCQSLPSYCHFYFPSLSLSLSAPSSLKLHLKFCFCKSLAWCEVKLRAGLMRMAAVWGYLGNNVKSCDDALTLTLILLPFFLKELSLNVLGGEFWDESFYLICFYVTSLFVTMYSNKMHCFKVLELNNVVLSVIYNVCMLFS